MSENDVIIKTEGVKVNFGEFWALKGIDIEVKRGGDYRDTWPLRIREVHLHQDTQPPATA